MPSWTTPKTDWVGTDTFSKTDWLRIVKNVDFLAQYYELQGIEFTPYTNVTDGETLLTADDRNYVVNTLEEMYRISFLSWSRGYVAPRFAYGSPWNSRDLNAIEDMCLSLYKYVNLYPDYQNDVKYYAGNEVFCGDALSIGLL